MCCEVEMLSGQEGMEKAYPLEKEMSSSKSPDASFRWHVAADSKVSNCLLINLVRARCFLLNARNK